MCERMWQLATDRARKPKQTGFTLIELMVVVIIIGILGMIGVPSYRAYVIRSQRTEAKDALVRLASNQEKFYLQNNTYAGDVALLGFANDLSDSGLYTLSIRADQVSFTATATPAPGSPMVADDECQSFVLDETGARDADPDPNGRCW